MINALASCINSRKPDSDEDGIEGDQERKMKRGARVSDAKKRGTFNNHCKYCAKGLADKTSAVRSHEARCIGKHNEFLTFSSAFWNELLLVSSEIGTTARKISLHKYEPTVTFARSCELLTASN